MKSKYYIKIGIVVFILGVVALSGCVQNQQKGPQNASQNTVTIQNFAFNPHTITIKAGTNVTWINQDSDLHDVTSDSEAFESKDLKKGETYTYNFTKPGEYPYHCEIHPNMTGTVVVR